MSYLSHLYKPSCCFHGTTFPTIDNYLQFLHSPQWYFRPLFMIKTINEEIIEYQKNNNPLSADTDIEGTAGQQFAS